MNKADLIIDVYNCTDVSKAKAAEIVNIMLDVFKERLVNEGELALHGIGTFTVVQRAARTVHNSQTGEKFDVPERKGVRFKVSQTLKTALNS